MVKGQLSEGYKNQMQDISKRQEHDLTRTDHQAVSLEQDIT
jgi:hypothetical protein